MIDFLIRTVFLHKEAANRLRFEQCLKNNYPELLSEAREFCTLIRNSKEYAEAKHAYDAYKDAEYCCSFYYGREISDWECKRETYSQKMTVSSITLVEKWKKLDDRFSFFSVVEEYQHLVKAVINMTSYDPKMIMLYSDHLHNGYEEKDRWLYVGHSGYSEEHFIEYCTIYDLMCLIGDYCDWSRCAGLKHLNTESFIKSPYNNAVAQDADEAYKQACEILAGVYDVESDERQLKKLNDLVSNFNKT